MITWTVWYSHDQTAEGEIVHNGAELDAALDHVMAISDTEWPALATISRPNDHSNPALYVGFHSDRGVLLFVSVEGGREFSRGSEDSDGAALLYMYMTSAEEFPSNAEVPTALVRKAAHEFADTGGRPTCVEWQLWEQPITDTESEWPDL
ncbi:MAG TPA: Imm1 family immunity protein [Pseudonocardiaceae bacterium]|nr:Imm1 family immunity protein [Pseudonocardiaceae bacterium]